MYIKDRNSTIKLYQIMYQLKSKAAGDSTKGKYLQTTKQVVNNNSLKGLSEVGFN
jgi:hypothetical protein